VRNGAGLFDLSPFGKIRVEGRDAEAVLQRICANDIAVAPGRIVYTQWLNRNGGVEADLTVARLSDEVFLVVTSSASVLRDLHWLKRHTPDLAHCVATDVTAGEACLAVMGPRSRALLAPLVNTPLDNDAFRFGTWREIEIGYAVARAHRISYVCELGWELYIPADMAPHVFDTLVARDAEVGLRLCGTHVLDSCRITPAVVELIAGDNAGVRLRPLVWDGTSLKLGGWKRREVRWRERGRAFAVPEPGDWVSIHWDFVCDRLTPAAALALDRATRQAMRAVNASATAAAALA